MNLYSGAGLGAHITLHSDISLVFPLINATVDRAQYFEKPEYIRFLLQNVSCSLYPREIMAAPFDNEDQALEFTDYLLEFINDLYDRRDTITPNYKKLRPISVMDIFKLLPRTNCRKCGFATCLAFAGALSQGKIGPEKCPEFKNPIYFNAVYPVYDKEGNLSSTVAIEIDGEKTRNEEINRQKYIEILERKLAEEKQKIPAGPEEAEDPLPTDLTDREKQVLQLVADGATNTEIADRLHISSHTVKSHVINIFNKLGVNDRTHAAVLGIRNKII